MGGKGQTGGKIAAVLLGQGELTPHFGIMVKTQNPFKWAYYAQKLLIWIQGP
jgi:hypothetical protein